MFWRSKIRIISFQGVILLFFFEKMKIWTTYTNVPTQKIPNRYHIVFLAQKKDAELCHRKMKKNGGGGGGTGSNFTLKFQQRKN